MGEFAWNQKAHLPLPNFYDLEQIIPTQQEGAFQPCPALEPARAVTADAPLPNRLFCPVVGGRHIATPLIQGVLLPVFHQFQDQ